MDEGKHEIPSILKSLLSKKDSGQEDPLAVVTPDPVIKPETFEELPGEIKQFSSEEKLQDKIKQEIFKQELPDDQLSHKVILSGVEIGEHEESIPEETCALFIPAAEIKQEIFYELPDQIKQDFFEESPVQIKQETFGESPDQIKYKQELPDQLPKE